MTRGIKFLLIVISLSDILLFVSTLQRAPSGYLHSWNQITTLAMIESISEDVGNVLYPKDVTTLLSWQKTEGNIASDPFTVYEEFPLYHLIVASLSPDYRSHIVIAKLITILFLAVFLCSIFKISKNLSHAGRVNIFSVLSVLISFPVLYYGQATMSDMPMTALLAYMLSCLTHPEFFQNDKWFLKATLSLALACLFKSYAIIFAPLLLSISVAKSSPIKKRVLGFLGFLLSMVPVIWWHWFAAVQSGHQEMTSHSLYGKLAILTSGQFYLTVLKYFVRYQGILPFIIMVTAIFIHSKNKFSLDLCRKYWWLFPWTAVSLVYLAATADKIIYHDYYMLVIITPLYIISGVTLNWAFERLEGVTASTGAFNIFAAIVLLTYSFSVKSFLKATKLNMDVHDCAQLIGEVADRNDLIVTLASSERYNSLQYFSRRRGFSFQREYTLSEYRRYGARYLVLDLSGEERINLERSLALQLDNLELIKTRSDLEDFRGRRRVCEIYALTSPIRSVGDGVSGRRDTGIARSRIPEPNA